MSSMDDVNDQQSRLLDRLKQLNPVGDYIVHLDLKPDDEDGPACAEARIDPFAWLGIPFNEDYLVDLGVSIDKDGWELQLEVEGQSDGKLPDHATYPPHTDPALVARGIDEMLNAWKQILSNLPPAS